MRIAIREQLALLVLFCALVGLAVISIATWVNNYNYVLGIRSSSLALTASLKASQMASTLLLYRSQTQALSTRALLQSALQRYVAGNNTAENWSRAIVDLQAALESGGSSALLMQCVVFPGDPTGLGGPYGLVNVTGTTFGTVYLPENNSSGSPAALGDADGGYPASLYPNLTYHTVVVNSTYNDTVASTVNTTLSQGANLLLGPLQINSSFSLFSLTVPIINNTSSTDIIAYMTVILNAAMLYDAIDSLEGLGNTGMTLLVGPNSADNRFPSGAISTTRNASDTYVKYVLPPLQNSSRDSRHMNDAFGQADPIFQMEQYPAVLKAYTKNNFAFNNAGSVVGSHNEENDSVSVGYALLQSSLCDWALLVEEDHQEVWAPINHLRNVLLACVFGTAGALALIVFPIAHFSVIPIRRLRAATKKTVEPPGYAPDNRSLRSFDSRDPDGDRAGDEENLDEVARKEGFLGKVSRWTSRKSRRRGSERPGLSHERSFRIPSKVPVRKHLIKDELTDLTSTFNEMSEELMMQYERLEERVRQRTFELEESKKAAEAANESKTLFIANISHELKTPLNGILGMCAVCMQEDDPSKIKRSLGIIYKSGDLLLHLLTDLLTFSKNQIGQNLSLEEKEFRIADISSQVLSIFDKQARDGNIKLRVTFQSPFEVSTNDPIGEVEFSPVAIGKVKDMCLWGDQHRILQVIINLVSNSLMFTPPGGTVDVRIKCLGETEDRASRKGSLQSRNGSSSLTSRIRSRLGSASTSSVMAPVGDPEKPRVTDTALEINAYDPKPYSHILVEERSPSPPPLNARVMLFDFEVEDSGPGIPENLQQRVFEPFVQGDLGLSKKYGGTGLGLSICAQLAKLMRGTINLKSQEGVGSTFTMRIPLMFLKERANSTTSSSINLNSNRNSISIPADESTPSDEQGIPTASNDSSNSTPYDAATQPRLVGLSQPFFASGPPVDNQKERLAATAMEMEREASQKGEKIRVLVAEDNKVNQEVVLRMLRLEDIYDVTVAKDGQEALDIVKQSMEEKNAFDLIFMDIQMPNLDGLQSTRLIRQMGYNAPIVALTAFAEESNVKECMDSGMNHFLAKPIRRPALKQVLKTYCQTIPEAEEGEASSPTNKEKPDSRPAPPLGRTSSSSKGKGAST